MSQPNLLCESVLETVGNTPLVHLRQLFADAPFEVYGKFEAFNPGGSMKDRPARRIIEHALRDGVIDAGTTVIESSSGNMGIGLAQACRYHGLDFTCVVDPRSTSQNLRMLRAYGATIDLVSEPDPESGEFLPARLRRVQTLLNEIDNSFWPNQYANLDNPAAHRATTMREIDDALDGSVDYLFVSVSTCGTVRGCSEYIEANELDTTVVAVDAVGSLIFSDEKSTRRIPGMGAGKKPELFHPSISDDAVRVTDVECVAACRRLAHDEALLVGGSAGGALAAVQKTQDSIPSGSNCVVILCDRGERYLNTVFSDEWVEEELGVSVDAVGAVAA